MTYKDIGCEPSSYIEGYILRKIFKNSKLTKQFGSIINAHRSQFDNAVQISQQKFLAVYGPVILKWKLLDQMGSIGHK